MTIGTHCDLQVWLEPAELHIARTRSCQSVPELNAFKTKFSAISLYVRLVGTDTWAVMRFTCAIMRLAPAPASFGSFAKGEIQLDMLPKFIQVFNMVIGTHCDPLPELAELCAAAHEFGKARHELK